MNKSRPGLSRFLGTLGTIVVVLVILLVVPLVVPKVFGLKLYSILSDSMSPTLDRGTLVLVERAAPEDVNVGDIISYLTKSDSKIVTTHRVVEITAEGFITKGDANNVTDAEAIIFSRLVGKVKYFIPHLGGYALFITSLRGIILIAIALIFAVCLWLISDIFKEKDTKKLKAVSGRKKKNPYYICGGCLLVAGVCYLGYIGIGYLSADLAYSKVNSELFEDLMQTEEILKYEGHLKADNLEELMAENDIIDVDKALTEAVLNLSNTYPNIKGWIRIDSTKVNYPIVQGKNDAYYLTHNYNDRYSSQGSIFLRAANNPDFSDSYTVLYGHNMRTDSMFGTLLKYEAEPEYINEHPVITIYTLSKKLEYEIFDYYYTEPTEVPYIEEASVNEHILILSTCSNNGEKRFVVCAKKIER